jgi:hypothetical protein
VANNEREFAAKAGRADSAGFRKPEEMKWYQRQRPMYDVMFVEKAGIDFASTVSVEQLVVAPPEWLLVEHSPLLHYSFVPTEVSALVAQQYQLAHEELAATPAATRARFDQQDAFYMPVAGFRGVERMGPALRLYRRAQAAEGSAAPPSLAVPDVQEPTPDVSN